MTAINMDYAMECTFELGMDSCPVTAMQIYEAATSAMHYWNELMNRPGYHTTRSLDRAGRWHGHAFYAREAAEYAMRGGKTPLPEVKHFCDAGYVY